MRGRFGSVVLVAVALALSGCSGEASGPRGGMSAAGNGAGGNSALPTSRPSLRTVVYLPSYNGDLGMWIARLDFANLSYVNLSFAVIDAGGEVSFPGAATLPAFVGQAHEAGAKVCIALGGATTSDGGGVFATLLQDGQRAAFVDKLVAFVEQNELDCLDVDLEGKGVNEYYEAFVTELGAKLKPQGHELTAAVASWFGDGISNQALETFDFVNVMAYDLYSSGNATPAQTSSIDAATREVDKWVARGLPREKAVFGVPFYGFSYAPGMPGKTISYADLLRTDAAAATQDQLQRGESVIYLNSRATIQAKAKLAASYGGIMAWEATQDASGDSSLLRAIREAVP